MLTQITSLALAASLFLPFSFVVAQEPDGKPPSGCELSYSGAFTFGTTPLGHGGMGKRFNADNVQEILPRSTPLSSSFQLSKGVLTGNEKGDTAFIASDNSLSFAAPSKVPSDALYTSGFSFCPNNTLALGSTTVWYQCGSSGYGLDDIFYDPKDTKNCREVFISALPIFFPTSMLSVSATFHQSVPLAPGPVSLPGTSITSGKPATITHTSSSHTITKGTTTKTDPTGTTAQQTSSMSTQTGQNDAGLKMRAVRGVEALVVAAGLAGAVL